MTQQKIVSIAGAGMHGGVWHELKGHMPEHDIRALDLPGHRSAETFLNSITDMAQYVTSYIGTESVILMGHSMGALVALAAAQNVAVRAIVLLGVAARMPVHPDLLQQARDNPDAANDMILKWSLAPENPQYPIIRDHLKKNMQETDARAVALDLAACDLFLEGAALASTCGKPALIIAGERDKMTKPAEGEKLSQMLAAGQFVLLPATGHMMMVENPEAVAMHLKTFLGSLPD